jgi:hypothetical protein
MHRAPHTACNGKSNSKHGTGLLLLSQLLLHWLGHQPLCMLPVAVPAIAHAAAAVATVRSGCFATCVTALRAAAPAAVNAAASVAGPCWL